MDKDYKEIFTLFVFVYAQVWKELKSKDDVYVVIASLTARRKFEKHESEVRRIIRNTKLWKNELNKLFGLAPGTYKKYFKEFFLKRGIIKDIRKISLEDAYDLVEYWSGPGESWNIDPIRLTNLLSLSHALKIREFNAELDEKYDRDFRINRHFVPPSFVKEMDHDIIDQNQIPDFFKKEGIDKHIAMLLIWFLFCFQKENAPQNT
ncbi:hypothetical protein GYB22_04490 [bacterium]|nr:hypothetical protein [bacterium]